MSVVASCPECSASSPVPDEMVGKKVRCKKCQTAFTVEGSVSKMKRPASKEGLSFDVKAGHSSKSGIKKPPKKSNALLWTSLTIVTLLIAGGVGFGVWYAMQTPEAPKLARAKIKKDEPIKSPKEEPVERAKAKDVVKKPAEKVAEKNADKGSDRAAEKGGDKAAGMGVEKIALLVEPRDAKKPSPPVPKTKPAGEIKSFEPISLTSLAASSKVELKEISAIKGVFPIANHEHKVGLHTMADKTHFFELYDLKKQERIAKVKLGTDVVLIDVDPDGAMLATVTSEKRFNIYSLPEGGLIEDEWAPYDNIKDSMRFLTGGKIAQIAMLGKGRFWVMTTQGFGDLWELPAKKVEYLIHAAERTHFKKDTVEANRDIVISQDRTLFAYATDEGIEFRDAATGKKVGGSPKFTKYGTKAELVGMGFEPGGTKLAAYFAANKDGARPYYHVRFSVPGGEELLVEKGADPGDVDNIEFVDANYCMMFDRTNATLRDGNGRVVAVCGFAGKSGVFASKVVRANLAFAFMTDKKVPAVGVARVPLSGPAAAAPVAVSVKGKSLSDLFAPVAVEAVAERRFEQQEIWEFGQQGVLKKAVRSFD